MKRILLFILLTLNVAIVMADAIGSWKLYPCYNNVVDIQPAGDKIYVLASGNLYSYNNHDTSLQEYNKTTGLSSSEITNIAWIQSAKKLFIIYSDYNIDLLSDNDDITCIPDYADKTITGDKTVNDIYVSGHYAYVSTGFGIIKIDVNDEHIDDTYSLGYNVNYCYIRDGYIYAASEKEGLKRVLLTSNLLDKNNWEDAGSYTPKTKDAYVYDSHNSCYWGADADSKLTKYNKQDDGTFIAVSTGVKPDGPISNRFWKLYKHDGKIFSTAGCHAYGMAAESYDQPGLVQIYDDGEWSKLSDPAVSFQKVAYQDANCMAFDVKDNSHYWVGAFSGLYEYRNNVVVNFYNTENSSMSGMYNTDTNHPNVTSMTYDDSGNLWVFNGWCDNFINCLSSDGTWKSYPHGEYNFENRYGIDHENAFVSSTNKKMWWTNDFYGKSVLYQYDYINDNLKGYTSFVNEDGTNVEASLITEGTEDKNGNVWIATSAGPIYLSKENISSGSNIFTQQKVPRNDGTNLADYLLSGIFIRCIKVDAVNRKWMGTDGNGIYLISSDNNTQIYNFTTNNSPLPSNTIYDILIDENMGIVYIATTKGLCSFQSDITSENENMSKDNVYAYPNPVTPDYTGMITIAGLSNGAQLKITTSSGQLVHSGTCNGGSYQWNGCNLNGKKVASGIYMVNVSTSEGEKGCVSKIGVIR